ncbi:MAG TPA: ankyrin repeat domain-containing protein [Nitrospira sp.]|nr:ankyrin repeat domain-containing protein [Nitrospira sp.]
MCLSIVTFQGVADVQADVPSNKAGELHAMSERATHRALTERSADQAGLLLDKGANIDARNSQGATSLMTAAGRGNLALLNLLIKRGARIDAADHEGKTALHEASFHNEVLCVEALLVAGAQPSVRNALGFTPLHQAVRRFWEIPGESNQDRLAKQANIIRLLLRYGADPSMLDGSGRTPAVLATQSTNGILQQAFVPSSRLAPLQALPSPSPASKPIPADSAAMSSTGQRPSPTDTAGNLPSFLPSPGPATASVMGIGEAPLSVPEATSKGAARHGSSEAHTHLERAETLTPPPATEANPRPAPPSPPPAEGRPLPRPSEVASPQPSVAMHGQTGTGETSQTAPTNAQAQTNAPESHLSQPLPYPSLPPSPTPTSPVAATTYADIPAKPPPPATTPPPDGVRQTDRNSIGLSHEPNAGSSSARTASPLASTSTQPPSVAAAETGPTAGRTPSSQDRTGELRTEGRRIPGLFHNVGFGLGLGWTHNLGPRRVDSVTVVNGTVRIDNEHNDLVRFMPEMHVWLDRWDEQRWSWGPFLAVAPGSRVIDAIGFGLMIGYRPHELNQYSFNLGIGGTLDLDTRVLGDGLVANEPLPPGETTARTKQMTAAGLLIMLSVGWDLAVPHKSIENDGR